MGYSTDILKDQCINVIDSEDVYYITDLLSHLPCSRATFYSHFPKGSENYNFIHELLKGKLISQNVSNRSRELNEIHKASGTGYVYLIKCEGTNYFKIGVSKSNLYVRIKDLQTGCPFELSYDAVYFCDHYSLLEIEIHKRYKKQCIRGEWFELTEQQLICIKSELYEQSIKQIKLF